MISKSPLAAKLVDAVKRILEQNVRPERLAEVSEIPAPRLKEFLDGTFMLELDQTERLAQAINYALRLDRNTSLVPRRLYEPVEGKTATGEDACPPENPPALRKRRGRPPRLSKHIPGENHGGEDE